MPKPPNAIVLGALETALPVASKGTGSLVPIDPAACRGLMAARQKTFTTEIHGHIYLRLESITGDYPTVLNVYVGLPDGAAPAEHPEHLGGSIGLYGLPQASRKRENGEGGQGMGFSLDVTRVFKELRLAGPPAPAAIRVSIVPYRPIPEEARVTIGKMSFFYVVEE
jgi:tyrosinase